MSSTCGACTEPIEPTGVEDVWQSVDSLDPTCPAGGDHAPPQRPACTCDGGHEWPFGGMTPHRDFCARA